MRQYSHYRRLGLMSAGSLAIVLTLGLAKSFPNASVAQQPDRLDSAVENSAETGESLPVIKQTSGESELELAQHLKAQGAKLYGAYWCPHCHDQHELFGKEAFEYLSYIECAPDGKASQTQHCETFYRETKDRTGQVLGFPAWVINGKVYRGRQSLENLAKYSGYQGPSKFKNNLSDIQRDSDSQRGLDDYLREIEELLSPQRDLG